MAAGPSLRSRHIIIGVLAVVLVGESAWLAYPIARDLIMPPRDNAAQRGRKLAVELGCFNCHGPGGTGGVPNPGSKTDEVPSFHEGTIMMYAHGDQDLREYILDGAPAAKLARPEYRAEQAAQALHMPAFKDVVSAAQVDDLVAFLRVVSGLLEPDAEPAQRGAELALTSGCFHCHGDMGIGGMPNPGSLKGYIPGFDGEDFRELVRNDDELRAWIAEGSIPRLRNDQLASYFIERQRIQMPAFKDHLAPADIEALVAYARWLANGEWQKAPLNP
jgi:mono/diheme cytochrome c family protein